LFPPTSKNTQNLIKYHPLVIFAGNNKPSASRNSKIEKL